MVSMANTITQLGFFRMLRHKFQRLADARKSIGHACSPRKKKICYFTGDRNEYELINGSLPKDVPKGYFAVYVGSERSRFIIPTSYLNHPLFQSLLKKAKEEYGFHHQMGLTIPCERVAFEYITSVLTKKHSAVRNMDLDEIIEPI